MPKKAKQESPEEQGERFKRDAQRMIDAGELDPEEAEAVVERIVRRAKRTNDDA